MIKSTNLCFSISSVWVFVIRNEISYPWFRPLACLYIQTQRSPCFHNPESHIVEEVPTHFYGLPPQNKERFCPLRQESGKFVYQDVLYIVCLFYLDAHAHTVD